MFNIQTKTSSYKTDVNRECSSYHHQNHLHHSHQTHHPHHHHQQEQTNNLTDKSNRIHSDHLNESSPNCLKHLSLQNIDSSDTNTCSKYFNGRNLLKTLRANLTGTFTDLIRNINQPKGKRILSQLLNHFCFFRILE